MSALEKHFAEFRRQIIGYDTKIATPYGNQSLIYADWAASGRLYRPIEDKLTNTFGPLVANTHTESNTCGEAMTQAYHEARQVIKKHVGATEKDVLLAAGSGMTSAVVLLQRLLGWRLTEQYKDQVTIKETDRPIVFVSQMEHHSNHTTWLETIADVVVVPSSPSDPLNMAELSNLLTEYAGRKIKVAAITAASNVTGVRLPVHEIAKLMHESGGMCFVDYTCAAPYDQIEMRPADDSGKLDAIYFSPHKFLGGPGTPGILVFDEALYKNTVPDRPGGGTVLWTNPWGGREYFNNIEVREDGGTPPFLGLIKAALAIKLKEKMGLAKIRAREQELGQVFFEQVDHPGVLLLDAKRKQRLPLFAFTVGNLHYNLVTRFLNDRFGIQARGGCACAGTYGHCLFQIEPELSKLITDQIHQGDLRQKPGFTRISLHPTMTDSDVAYITSAIREMAEHGTEWAKDYDYDPVRNEFGHRKYPQTDNWAKLVTI